MYQVTQKNGERCSAARAYIHPHCRGRTCMSSPERRRARILFENGRAAGAEYQRRRQGRAGDRGTRGHRQLPARCSRRSCSCCPASATPRICREHGIEVVQHLPGVGRNLQDHVDYVFGFQVPEPAICSASSLGGAWRLL